MKRALGAALILALVPALAAAQDDFTPTIDNSVPLDALLPTPLEQAPDAIDISKEIFGKRDEAFGAYQRGFYLTALALALPRAEQADPAAQTLIAEIYANGLGVASNVATASSWYALAAKNGDRMAAFELGLLYLHGEGVPENAARAAELFKQAADKDYAPAQYNLALLHIEGQHVAPSLKEAARLMKLAADAGLAEAQYDYGTMLIQGAGVSPNTREGAGEIARAAEQGLLEAQVDYATLLYLGEGVPRDLNAAVGWYSRAAAAGHPVAQNRYAKLLAVGEGTKLDPIEAAMWRALARRQGLSDPQLDALLVSLPSRDLALAEERARFWPSRPPGEAVKIVPEDPAGESAPAPLEPSQPAAEPAAG